DFTVCVVDMLTTEGSSFSAKSAKLSGAGRAADGSPAGSRTSNTAVAMTAERRNREDSNDTCLTPRSRRPTAAGRIGATDPRDSRRADCLRDPNPAYGNGRDPAGEITGEAPDKPD